MDNVFESGTGKLGFGLMRLPRKGVFIDAKVVSQMVDEFLEAGFTYFDTAHVYPGSEDAARKTLVDRYPRAAFTLATKLHPMLSPTAKVAKNQLATSLRRLKTSYIDFYLLHAISDGTYKRYEKMGLWQFASDQKAAGSIRHVGFSFHGGPEILDKLLTEHPETEFVQLQINYADWESPRVQSRENYEVARAHGVPIVVMEPVKGGDLVKLPAQAKAVFDELDPSVSYASWALRYAASFDGVAVVLSGMSDIPQLRDNLSTMADFRPLDAEERQAVHKVQEIMGARNRIECTACGYCTKGCPKQIPIPEIFAAMNERFDGQADAAQASYDEAVAGRGRASDCIACTKCEQVCTQNLSIVQLLRDGAHTFE